MIWKASLNCVPKKMFTWRRLTLMRKRSLKFHIKLFSPVIFKSSEINSTNLKKPLKSTEQSTNQSLIKNLHTPWKNLTSMISSCPSLRGTNFLRGFLMTQVILMLKNYLERLLGITTSKKMNERRKMVLKTTWSLLKSKRPRRQKTNRVISTWKKLQWLSTKGIYKMHEPYWTR